MTTRLTYALVASLFLYPLAACVVEDSGDERPDTQGPSSDGGGRGDTDRDEPFNPYACAIGIWDLEARTGPGGCFDDFSQDRTFSVEPTRDGTSVVVSIVDPYGNEVIDSVDVVGADTACELTVFLSRDEPEDKYGYTELYTLYRVGSDVEGTMIDLFQRYSDDAPCEDFFSVEGTHSPL